MLTEEHATLIIMAAVRLGGDVDEVHEMCEDALGDLGFDDKLLIARLLAANESR